MKVRSFKEGDEVIYIGDKCDSIHPPKGTIGRCCENGRVPFVQWPYATTCDNDRWAACEIVPNTFFNRIMYGARKARQQQGTEASSEGL